MTLSRMILLCICVVFLVSGCKNNEDDEVKVDDSVYEALVLMDEASFLYCTEDDSYEEARIDAVDVFLKTMKASYKASSEFYHTLGQYKSALIDGLDKVDSEFIETSESYLLESTGYEMLMAGIYKEMLAYEDMNPDKDLAVVVNTQLMYSISDLAVAEDFSLDYYIKCHDYLRSNGVDTDVDMEELRREYAEMIYNYELMTYQYTLIVSADYYHSEEVFEEAQGTLEELWNQYEDKENDIEEEVLEEAEVLLKAYKSAYREPSQLIEVSSGGFKHVSFKGEASGEGLLDKVHDSRNDKKLKESIDLDYKKSQEAKAFEKMVRVKKDHGFLLIGAVAFGQADVKSVDGVDARYDKISQLIIKAVKKSSKIPEGEELDKFKDKVNNDFVTMLGDNKSAFVDKIISMEVNELIDMFNAWKDNTNNFDLSSFDDGNLLALADYMGIDLPGINVAVEEGETIEPEKDVSEDKPSGPRVDEVIKEDDYIEGPTDHVHIIASFDDLKAIDENKNNAELLKLIYGWEDPIDYTQFTLQKEEIESDQMTSRYVDGDGVVIGWEMIYRGDYLNYTYHFPDPSMGTIVIDRNGSPDSSVLEDIYTTDIELERTTMYKLAEEENLAESPIDSIYEKHKDNYDGIHAYASGYYVNEEYYEEGILQIKRLSKYDVILSEEYYNYEGEDVLLQQKKYEEEEGFLNFNAHYKNGVLDGIKDEFNSDGILVESCGYSDGVIHGDLVTYSDTGIKLEWTSYFLGVREGIYESYNDLGWVEQSGYYSNDLMSGDWIDYDLEGVVITSQGYKDGLKDGDFYHQGNDKETTGYYKEGKKHGEFVYKYKGKVINTHYYEEDVSIWQIPGEGGEKVYTKHD